MPVVPLLVNMVLGRQLPVFTIPDLKKPMGKNGIWSIAVIFVGYTPR
jgi:hypothetical protein